MSSIRRKPLDAQHGKSSHPGFVFLVVNRKCHASSSVNNYLSGQFRINRVNSLSSSLLANHSTFQVFCILEGCMGRMERAVSCVDAIHETIDVQIIHDTRREGAA